VKQAISEEGWNRRFLVDKVFVKESQKLFAGDPGIIHVYRQLHVCVRHLDLPGEAKNVPLLSTTVYY